MNGIDRRSRPDTGDPPITSSWRGLPRLGWSDLWWGLWIVGLFVFQLAIATSEGTTADADFGGAMLIEAMAWGITALSADAAGITVVIISRRLRRPAAGSIIR